MPWKPEDAERHKKGLSEKQKRAWAEIANSALKSCLASGEKESVCEARAIRIANAMVKRVKDSDNVERVIRLNAAPRQLREISGELRQETIRHDAETGVLTAEVIISQEAVLPYEGVGGRTYL